MYYTRDTCYITYVIRVVHRLRLRIYGGRKVSPQDYDFTWMVGRGGSGQFIAVLHGDGPANYGADVRFANIIAQLDFHGPKFYTQKNVNCYFFHSR